MAPHNSPVPVWAVVHGVPALLAPAAQGRPGLSSLFVQLGWDNGPTATPGVLLKGQSTRRGAWRQGRAQHCRWGSRTKAALPRASSSQVGRGVVAPSVQKCSQTLSFPNPTGPQATALGPQKTPAGITPLTHQSLGTPSPAATAPAPQCLGDAHGRHEPSLPQDAVPGLLGVPWIFPGCPQLWHM